MTSQACNTFIGRREACPATGAPALVTGRRLAIALCLVGLGLSVLLSVLSDGAHHDDDLTHFLYAKWSLGRACFLLHEWGRPGFTALYALPSQLGWTAACAFSGLVTVLAAWLAYRTADAVHLPRAWLAAPLTLIQPMFFQLSYTTLTETPLAFYLALAVWLLVTRRFGMSAFVLSLALVTRHESVVWLPIWAMAMWHGRARWWTYPLLLWAPVLHNVLSGLLLDTIPILMFLEPKANVQYGSGSALAMWGRAVLAYGPGMAALGCVGAVLIPRKRHGWIVAGAVVAYFGFHAFCRALGLYATGGYPRFLIPISPMLAVLAVAAVDGLVDWSARRWWLRAAGLAGAFVFFWFAAEWEKPWWVYPPFILTFRLGTLGFVLTTCAVIWIRFRRPRLQWTCWLMPIMFVAATAVHTAYLCRPWRMNPEQQSVRSVVDWLGGNGYGRRRFISANVWVQHFTNTPADPGEWLVKDALAQADPGTILIWDRCYCPAFPHNMALTDYLDNPDYRLLTKSWPAPGVFCYAFEKLRR